MSNVQVEIVWATWRWWNAKGDWFAATRLQIARCGYVAGAGPRGGAGSYRDAHYWWRQCRCAGTSPAVALRARDIGIQAVGEAVRAVGEKLEAV